MTLLLVDFGGTRLKICSTKDSQSKLEIGVQPSPFDYRQMLRLVKEYQSEQKEDASQLALSLQGPVDLDQRGSWEYGPPQKRQVIRRPELNEACLEIGLPLPQITTNDVIASAFGLAQDGSGCNIQLSTGIGARVLRQGKLLVTNDLGPILSAISKRRQLRVGASTRTYYEWLRFNYLHDWLAPELKGMEWRQLATQDHPDVTLIAEIFISFIEECLSVIAELGDFPLYVSGGGAAAMRHRLEPALHSLGHKPIFDSSGTAAGIAGLQYLLRQCSVPILTVGPDPALA